MTYAKYTERDFVPQDHQTLSFLYVIQAGNGPIKVGVSDNPFERLKQLQTGHYETLHLRYCQQFPNREAALAHERQFHAKSEPWKMEGEWFDMRLHDALTALLVYYLPFQKKLAGALVRVSEENWPPPERSIQ